jgi:bacterioferritin-associated ferredoxin
MSQTQRADDDQHQISRRTLLAAAAAFAVSTSAYGESVRQNMTKEARMPDATSNWPHGARLAVSFSLMFEAGGQPISGAGGVIPDPIQQGLPDLPTNATCITPWACGSPCGTCRRHTRRLLTYSREAASEISTGKWPYPHAAFPRRAIRK